MFRPLSRFLVATLIAVGGLVLAAAPVDSDAARLGGGSSAGRQSANVSSQRPSSSMAPASTMQRSATPPAPAVAAPKSGASRWLGPLAGIAAGLGIAALMSHFGMSGAFGSLLGMVLLAGLVVFVIMFVMRMLRGGASQPAMQAMGTSPSAQPSYDMMRESSAPGAQQTGGAMSSAGFGSGAVQPAQNWSIPTDFDSTRFLQEAKNQFVAIQKVWDSGDVSSLRNFLTDDLMIELQAQLNGRTSNNHTEVVLLNAEMLGIEKVTDGNLASVRFSGMLREQAGAEAFRFEEVWNLFKPEKGGWLLAGIQQIPVLQAS